MLNIKTPKHIQSTLYEETEEYYQKTCNIYSFYGCQVPKRQTTCKRIYIEKKRTLPKTLMNVFFFVHFLTYENSKTHAKRLY